MEAINSNLPGPSSICINYVHCSYNKPTYSFKGKLYHADSLSERSGKIPTPPVHTLQAFVLGAPSLLFVLPFCFHKLCRAWSMLNGL